MIETESEYPRIGIDVVEIQRFRDLPLSAPFYKRVFTNSEVEYCTGFSEPSVHFASTFAGKEAVMKTLSGEIVSFKQIEIHRTDSGAPIVRLKEHPELRIVISLSHSSEYAVAAALVTTGDVNLQRIQQSLDIGVRDVLTEVNK